MLKNLIQEENVIRDNDGYWCHSKYPDFGENANKYEIQRWEENNGILVYFDFFEHSASDKLLEEYFDEGSSNISKWIPNCYSEDSFLLTIHQTEDSPIAIFAIKTQERLNQEIKKKLINF